MSARDELAALIDSETHVDWFSGSAEELAGILLAAGYRKPRIIAEVEQLEPLGASAAILAANGAVWVNDGDTEEPWACVTEDFQGGPLWVNDDGIHLPATILYEGPTP